MLNALICSQVQCLPLLSKAKSLKNGSNVAWYINRGTLATPRDPSPEGSHFAGAQFPVRRRFARGPEIHESSREGDFAVPMVGVCIWRSVQRRESAVDLILFAT